MFGRDVVNYLVGVVEFQSRIDGPGILGLDFFLDTDLLLAFRREPTSLEWWSAMCGTSVVPPG